MPKSDLRRQYLLTRKDLQPTQVEQWSHQIQTHVLQRDEVATATCLALYTPIHNEVDTKILCESAWRRSQELCLPQWDPMAAAIRFYLVRPDSPLRPTRWGTREPIPEPENERKVDDLDLIIVPGVVFDKSGYRLGYGHGGYDRILAAYNGLTIGLAYELQIVDTLPREPHDVPCSSVITESGALKP